MTPILNSLGSLLYEYLWEITLEIINTFLNCLQLCTIARGLNSPLCSKIPVFPDHRAPPSVIISSLFHFSLMSCIHFFHSGLQRCFVGPQKLPGRVRLMETSLQNDWDSYKKLFHSLQTVTVQSCSPLALALHFPHFSFRDQQQCLPSPSWRLDEHCSMILCTMQGSGQSVV